ncbi:MAG: phosphate/phosphite/phosphonate ABC transporter substrate-binding protein [Anaerolineales bacterium]|nr:phosphate/phosphite/phosphonate ABC transporter substrate-binding protein [Anaerolineales bacterium]
MNDRNKPKSQLTQCVVFLTLVMVLLTGCLSGGDYVEIDLGDTVNDVELHAGAELADTDVFYFGFDLRANPQEDARQYLPFLQYLEETTGYTFELRFTPKDGQIVDDLGTGVVQFAAIGAVSYIQAHAQYGVIPLARGLNSLGQAEYQSVIVVAPDSPIETIEDLGGVRFAFGSVTSTQGHLIPRIILVEYGLTLDDLAAYAYTGSHHNCANAVTAGRFDACGMQDTMGEELAEAGLLRIIHTSRYYPSSGIAANKDVPPEVLDKVLQALLDFDPLGREAAALYHWDKTEMPNGFVEARDEDYAKLREWAIKLGYFPEEK